MESKKAPKKGKNGKSGENLTGSDLSARGEPFVWGMGGALSLGIAMIFGFLLLILWNGIITFYPKPIQVVTLTNSKKVAGEPSRSQSFKPPPDQWDALNQVAKTEIEKNLGFTTRTLYRTGNFDLYNEDFVWVSDYDVTSRLKPQEIFFVERVEWGPFIGFIESLKLNDEVISGDILLPEKLHKEHKKATGRRKSIQKIERGKIGKVNYDIERERLALRRVEMDHGKDSAAYKKALDKYETKTAELEIKYLKLQEQADAIKNTNSKYEITLAEVNGRERTILLSHIVRLYSPNNMGLLGKMGIYFARWGEFLTAQPREANTEGGVMPAIFGTFVMTVLMAFAVAPFGVVAALYLREYAKQGRLVSIVRISVNNLAGVPSIVYGVFGLGFFAYIIGAGIDELLFPERLPNPTFGTGGVLWASFTLALLTVPVVIVATEEALAAVPQSMREGSLACGASKWQTIKNVVLPKAMPGIMTGLILAMARGAGEVAPLMLVGVVKLAPELPIDQVFPFVHLERAFMHLGFHIYDVGFQSRNSEAARPMVFVTTLLLITLIGIMNATAIYVRNRLKRKYYVGHF